MLSFTACTTAPSHLSRVYVLQEHVGVHSRPVGPVPQITCRSVARGHRVGCQPRSRRRAARRCVVVRPGLRMRLLRMLDHARTDANNRLDLTMSSARCRSFRLSRCSKLKFQCAGDFWVLHSLAACSCSTPQVSPIQSSRLSTRYQKTGTHATELHLLQSARHRCSSLTIIFMVHFLQAGSSPEPVDLYCRQCFMHLLLASLQLFVAALRKTVCASCLKHMPGYEAGSDSGRGYTNSGSYIHPHTSSAPPLSC